MTAWKSTLAARRKLLRILPRKELEQFSQSERPHMATKTELVDLAATKGWDTQEVHEAIARIFRRAAP